MAFYGIGNLFGNVVRQEAREKEAAREAEDKKAEQEKATKKEEAVQVQQDLETQASNQAEAQRQRLLQLQEKVARRLEDFVRASGRDKAPSSESEAEAAARQLENEQDSFTPENLQRLRQLSQNAKGVLQGTREARQESRDSRTEEGAAKPDSKTAQDLELQSRRITQELKTQLRHTEGQATGRAQQEAREAGRDTSTDTRSQKAQETDRAQKTAPEKAPARPEKAADAAQAEMSKPKLLRSEPSKAQAARAEAPKADKPKPELLRSENGKTARPEGAKPKAELLRPETNRPELLKPEASKPEVARPKAELLRFEAPKAQAAKPEAPQAQTARPEAAKPEAPQAQTARPEAAKPEAPQAQTARPEAAKPEAPQAQTAKPEAAKPEGSTPEGADPARSESSRPPRPQILRARGEGTPARASESRSDAKAPEGKPQAEDPHAASNPRQTGPSRFGGVARPESAASRPGQTAQDQAPAARADNARRATPESGSETAARSGPAPEGPRTARGQETAGGAGVSTGGSTQEKTQARLGDARFAPHLEAERAEGQEGQAPQAAHGKQGGEQAREAPRGGRGGEPAGRTSQDSGSRGQMSFATMGLGLGSITPGSSRPGFLRSGLGLGAPGEGTGTVLPKPREEEAGHGSVSAPAAGKGGDASSLGLSLGALRPTPPEPVIHRPPTPPPAPEPEPPGRPGALPPAEDPRDSLELNLPPRPQVGSPSPGPGAPAPPRRVLEIPRPQTQAPKAADQTSGSAGTSQAASGAVPAQDGPGLASLSPVGAPTRSFPGLTPRPVGTPTPGLPQNPASPERLQLQPRTGELPIDLDPARTTQNTPRSVQLGGIRIPAPDGKDESSRRDSDPADEVSLDGLDSGSLRINPTARLTPRPGTHTPIQGPRHERGPVGRVEGWQAEEPRSESPRSRRARGRTDSPGGLPIPEPSSSHPEPPRAERIGRIDLAGNLPESRQRPGVRGPQDPLPSAGDTPSRPADQHPARASRVGAQEGRPMPTVGTPRPSNLPVFRGPGGVGEADFLPASDARRAIPELPGSKGSGAGQFQLNLETLRRSPFRSQNETVPEAEAPDQPVRPFAPLPKGDWGARQKSGVATAPPAADGSPSQTQEAHVAPTAAGGADQPRIELLRPRPQGRLLSSPPVRPEAQPTEAGPRPGTHTPAVHLANGTEQARRAARIMSGDTPFVATGAGYAGRLPDPAAPAEFRATVTRAHTDRSQGTRETGAIAPRGPLGVGRPVISQIPIYQPILDLIYQVRGKARVEAESSPIKMTLSGSVGHLERQTYVRREMPVAPQDASRESADPGHHRVQTASDRNPLLGTMTASMRGPGEAVRQESAAARAEAAPGKGEASSQRVVETGERSGGGHRGGTAGREGGQGPQGESTSPGAPSNLQAHHRMQTLRASATHEAFRISMARLDGAAGVHQRTELAVRHASTSIPAMLKRIYRSQDLEDLDETEAVNSLAMMLKISGDFTYDHSARVLEFALDLAEELGIKDARVRRQIELGAMFKDIGEAGLLLAGEPEDKQDEIARFMSSQDMRRAGLLHDIGKLQIPRNILYKPGRMTDEEYELMKMHPIFGEKMVYPILSLRHLCPTIRGHHERWDGQGYPDGLKGQKIPLPARILAVVDVFDALHAERPYKASMDMEQVRALLAEGRGTHFDPDCVEAFLRVLERRFPQAARRRSRARSREGSAT